MTELVDRLAELTGQRDRDVLDATLVEAFRDILVDIEAVSIHRRVGEPGQERWLTRARLVGRDPVAQADTAWSELEDLPLLDDHPAWLAALQGERLVEVRGATHLTVFPVSTDREVVGVLEIETHQALDATRQRMVTSILRIYRNFQGLLDYSERDTLTGLLNRKTFDESFLKATAGSVMAPDDRVDGRRGASTGYWIGVIDIDHFKRVNDTCGHLIGDEVLLLLARLMRGSLRFHDRIYRFGGEEFVVLLRCKDDDSAALAFERLRSNAERYAFPQAGRITVSIGFAEVKAGDTPGAAFERADKAVYHAKAHGRNQAQSHALLVARGELEDAPRVGDIELF
ncbi:MAG: GGDEF domain-containing protein [Burkholderiales bacterium]|nr:GGDEF domain-containing protein [Burkholderiales bacterium]MDE2626311.1 GGDEF domain-containing protein [Burkholderiales bacterium]